MPRAAEMLARLNPSTCRFDMVRGGTPDMTNIDIAGALGMVTSEFNQALLQTLYCHEAAPGAIELVESVIYGEVMMHVREQKEALVDAEMRELTAQTPECVKLARRIYDKVRFASFPDKRERIIAVLTGVIIELRRPTHCDVCNGRGTFKHNLLFVTCTKCIGTGIGRTSERARASWCGMSVSGFREHRVQTLHRWLWDRLSGAAKDARKQLSAALKGEELPDLPENPNVTVEFYGSWE